MSSERVDQPPKKYEDFTNRFPRIAAAWGEMGEASQEGPLDEKVCRLVKLGISVGARARGATHSAVRRALAAGALPEEIYQVVALAGSTVGMPNAVAAFSWIEDELEK